ncbi:hypothetical protein FGO68_gene4181 [Halteria grandinella]|uniref:Uncharacterized protein n=1 Tax=Halteria grandinella TaxID=5974 RepID=A0A8J8SYT6_HALGN|nr:hypothetical protein FGO68_gene4181 [Halteria grandinella]
MRRSGGFLYFHVAVWNSDNYQLENTIIQSLPCIRTVCTSDKFCSYLPFSCLNWSIIFTFSKKTNNITCPQSIALAQFYSAIVKQLQVSTMRCHS